MLDSWNPWTVACQAPLSIGFSRQEYWSGLPFPSPGDLPNLGIEPGSPALQADSLPTELWGKPLLLLTLYQPKLFSTHVMKQDKFCVSVPQTMYINPHKVHSANKNANKYTHKGDSFSVLESICIEWFGSLLPLTFALKWKVKLMTTFTVYFETNLWNF